MLYGIGVGPGPKELLTLAAVEAIQASHTIAYICDQQEFSYAKSVCEQLLNTQHQLLPIKLPMQNNRDQALAVYRQSATHISTLLAQHYNVGVLCLGDPMLYGSFIHLNRLIESSYTRHIIPGISAAQYLAAKLNVALATQKDNIAFISGLDQWVSVQNAILNFNTVVIYKPAKIIPTVMQWIKDKRLNKQCYYGEHLGHSKEKFFALNDQIVTPTYMSLLIVHSGIA